MDQVDFDNMIKINQDQLEKSKLQENHKATKEMLN